MKLTQVRVMNIEPSLEPEKLSVGDKFFAILPNGTVCLYRVDRSGATIPLSESVYSLGLSVRTTNTLRREASIETIGDLIKKSLQELSKTLGLGRKAIRDIVSALEKRGLSLRSE